MLLGKKQMLYELFLVLDCVLMLGLCVLCGQNRFFMILRTHKLVVSINFHFFPVKMVNQYVNHAILQDI